MFKQGTLIFSRELDECGKATGTQKKCMLDGCKGQRIGVRWENKKLTWPCSEGIVFVKALKNFKIR